MCDVNHLVWVEFEVGVAKRGMFQVVFEDASGHRHSEASTITARQKFGSYVCEIGEFSAELDVYARYASFVGQLEK